MNTLDLLLVAVLLVLLAEVTYILARLPRTTLKTKRRAVLVDTSVLMDGRITAVAKTGFIGDTLVIPRSVVGELQLLADGGDSDKRSRARLGLDVVTELQAMPEVDVELLQDGTSASEGVDNRLLSLAKQHSALIMTIDYNLNKVAGVEGIQVLNVNDLAQSIRMAHLPGEHLQIELVQKGNDAHQGVGYLPDGTMVVVEQSSAYVGKIVQIEIIRSLQTSAGKMMFARRIGEPTGEKITAKTQVKRTAKTRSQEITHGNQQVVPAQKHAEHKPQRANQADGRARREQDKQDTRSESRGRAQDHSTNHRTKQVGDGGRKRASTQPARRPQDHEANLLSLVEKQDN